MLACSTEFKVAHIVCGDRFIPAHSSRELTIGAGLSRTGKHICGASVDSQKINVHRPIVPLRSRSFFSAPPNQKLGNIRHARTRQALDSSLANHNRSSLPAARALSTELGANEPAVAAANDAQAPERGASTVAGISDEGFPSGNEAQGGGGSIAPGQSRRGGRGRSRGSPRAPSSLDSDHVSVDDILGVLSGMAPPPAKILGRGLKQQPGGEGELVQNGALIAGSASMGGGDVAEDKVSASRKRRSKKKGDGVRADSAVGTRQVSEPVNTGDPMGRKFLGKSVSRWLQQGAADVARTAVGAEVGGNGVWAPQSSLEAVQEVQEALKRSVGFGSRHRVVRAVTGSLCVYGGVCTCVCMSMRG